MTQAAGILTRTMVDVKSDWKYHHSPLAHGLATKFHLTESTAPLFAAVLVAFLHKIDDVVSGEMRGDGFWDLCAAEAEKLSKNPQFAAGTKSAITAAGGSAKGVCHRLFLVLMVGDVELTWGASSESVVAKLNKASKEDVERGEQARKAHLAEFLKKWEGASENVPAARFHLEALRSWDIDANLSQSGLADSLVRLGVNEDKAGLVARGTIEDSLPIIQEDKDKSFSSCCLVATISAGVLVVVVVVILLVLLFCRGKNKRDGDE